MHGALLLRSAQRACIGRTLAPTRSTPSRPAFKRSSPNLHAATEAVATLTDSVYEAEARLAALFEPGKPMPRAAVVARLRQQIADMKAQIAGLIAADATPLSTGSEPGEDASERTYLAMLEVERSLASMHGRGTALVDDSAEVAELQAENERLRVEAQTLLMRQQQLEDLWEKVIQERKEKRQRFSMSSFNSDAATAEATDMISEDMQAHLSRELAAMAAADVHMSN